MAGYKKLSQQAVLLAVFRVLTIVGQFLFLRQLTLSVGMADAGIFLGIISVFQWIVLFDFGLSKGARNIMTGHLENGRVDAARQVVSTVVLTTTIISILLVPLFYLAFILVPQVGADIHGALFFFSLCIGLYLIVSGIDQACYVLHIAFVVYAAKFLNVGLSVVIIGILILVMKPVTIELLLIGFAFAMVLPHIAIYVWLVRRHPWLRPVLAGFDRCTFLNILSPGVILLLIQFALLLLVGLDRIVLLYFGTAEDVARYDIAFRLFGLALLPVSFWLPQVWAALRSAQENGDLPWIRTIYRRSTLLVGLTVLGVVVIALLWSILTQLWLGAEVPMSGAELAAFGTIFIATAINTFTNDAMFSLSHFSLVLWSALLGCAIKLLVFLPANAGEGALELLTLNAFTAAGYGTLAFAGVVLLVRQLRHSEKFA